jgi:hypothetical protein
MSDKAKRKLLVTVLGALYWIILPTVLYLTAGSQAIIAFAVLNLAAIGGTALVAGRAGRA